MMSHIFVVVCLTPARPPQRKGLHANRGLTSLDIGTNPLLAEGTKLLAHALKANRTLRIVSMKGNRMGDEGAKEVMVSALFRLLTSHVLPLQIADLLKENQTIKSLHLSTNNISDEGVTHIAEALKSNTCVEEINLSMNKVRRSKNM